MSRNPRHRATPQTAEDLELPAWVDRLDAWLERTQARIIAALERLEDTMEAWSDRVEARIIAHYDEQEAQS